MSSSDHTTCWLLLADGEGHCERFSNVIHTPLVQKHLPTRARWVVDVQWDERGNLLKSCIQCCWCLGALAMLFDPLGRYLPTAGMEVA